MGAGTTIAAIGFVIIGLVVAYAMFEPAFAGLVDTATGLYTATQLQPRVGADEIICDVRISITAALTSDPLKLNSPQFIRINEINGVQSEFFDCHNFSEFPLFSFVDAGARIDQFTVISFGQTIPVELTLRDRNDPTQKVDKFTQPSLAGSVEIPPTFTLNQVDASIEFVVTNIPLREYNAEIIYVGFPINDDELPFSTPAVFPIRG